MMKYGLLAILLVILFTACTSSKNESIKLPLNNEDTLLYGNWSMCSISSGDVSYMYNVCPQVTFNPFWGGNDTERFNWYLLQKKLHITYPANEKKNTLFHNGVFNVSVTTEGDSRLLMLTDTLGNSYYLNQ